MINIYDKYTCFNCFKFISYGYSFYIDDLETHYFVCRKCDDDLHYYEKAKSKNADGTRFRQIGYDFRKGWD